jgi:hypothetical protein
LCRRCHLPICRRCQNQIYQIVLKTTIWQTIWHRHRRHKTQGHTSPCRYRRSSCLSVGEWAEIEPFMKSLIY